MPVTERGHASDNAGATRGEVPGHIKLAEVKFSDVHWVGFWQRPSGSVTVLEEYNVDLTQGSKLGSFRAGRDSYAELYERLSGDNADPAALDRLRAVDVARRSISSGRAETASSDPVPVVTRLPETRVPDNSDGLVEKSVASDWEWFRTGFCVHRERTMDGEDRAHCHGVTLTPSSGWVVTWVLEEYESANIAVFNAASTGIASLAVAVRECFLNNFCDVWESPTTMIVPSRFVMEFRSESDRGFRTRAEGTSMALHYMFWF